MKSALFLPIKMSNSVDKLAKIYINEVVRLHGIPVSIVSDRNPRFTSQLWLSIQHALGTRLDMSTAFHPQTDGQLERVIQVLEDLLQACVLEFGGNWEEHMALVEFTYNNSHQATIGMPHMKPCMVGGAELLYVGRKLGTRSYMARSWSKSPRRK